jgi:hypothetical protein
MYVHISGPEISAELGMKSDDANQFTRLFLAAPCNDLKDIPGVAR